MASNPLCQATSVRISRRDLGDVSLVGVRERAPEGEAASSKSSKASGAPDWPLMSLGAPSSGAGAGVVFVVAARHGHSAVDDVEARDCGRDQHRT